MFVGQGRIIGVGGTFKFRPATAIWPTGQPDRPAGWLPHTPFAGLRSAAHAPTIELSPLPPHTDTLTVRGVLALLPGDRCRALFLLTTTGRNSLRFGVEGSPEQPQTFFDIGRGYGTVSQHDPGSWIRAYGER